MTDDYLSYLDHALERELLYGCTDRDIQQELRLDARATYESHRAAVALIRELRENPSLRVWYTTSKRHTLPNPDNLIDIYVDENGYHYWIEPVSLAIVQSFSQTDPYPAARAPRPRKGRPDVASIREKALSLLNRLVPSFEHRYTQLHPFEGNDGGMVYHFRWDDYTAPVAESDDAPFVHISLSADGRLQSFTNALTAAQS